MKLQLVLSLGLLAFVSASHAPIQFVGGRWEYWNFYVDGDFGAHLEDVPVDDTCTKVGYNPVIISYSDWTFTVDENLDPTFKNINDQVSGTGAKLNGQELKQQIRTLRNNGADVYIEVGGTFSFGSVLTSSYKIKNFVTDLVARTDFYRLKGVAFSQIAIDSAATMVAVIAEVKKQAPKLKIIYVIPAFGSTVAPWKDVIPQVKNIVSYIQVEVFDYYSSSYVLTQDFETMRDMGISYSKMIWGVMPGCSHNTVEYTSIGDAKDIAEYVAKKNLAGVIISTINRDTDHRTNLHDCVSQTGKPDGYYSKVIRQKLCYYN